ncbi:hypothetical protein GXW83_03250 [Streptacidiphilus sp. PB12-B1b]|uniref:hypothetical protein n=1 Tax=Streptacidiphilus sp. PB12-B1b TaxID=2705012 RepID=UPI0015F8642E|nr:hypothetical protein [Streptacidiphilus sp. PB12-B1b]QMU74926.1 hypothetical protein GXW83_03250 [Streptacidiphilus sp. PB12-B1b]
MPEARWVRDESRKRWAALGFDGREELFRLAREGKPSPDVELSLAAVHWSWAVLGRPDARRSYPLGDALLHFAPAAMFDNVYNGTRQHDFRRSVRREARRVEAANLPRLRQLGIDTSR